MIEPVCEKAKKDGKEAEYKANDTTSQELFHHLFEACNILRGPINQDEYKSYVTPILFLKRISDVYDEEYEEALEASGGDIKYAEAEDKHSFVIPDGCHWKDIREKSSYIGKAINDAMAGIEKANPKTLGGLFSSFDDVTWTNTEKLSDARLKDLVEHMSSRSVGNKNYCADIMGDSYEFLIKKFADLSKKNAGEFYTPRPVVKLMVRLLNPQPGETVYDPACGTGGMLIEAIHYMHHNRLSYGRIFGQENNLSTSAIARMNLYLHGAKDVKIVQGDTLRNPLFIEKGKLKTFDCVLANPPFGMEKWGADLFESDKYGRNIWGSPTDASADFAWLQHMIKSMDTENGRCAVVMPQGVLFHGGKEGNIRSQLVNSDKLEAVITLVGGLFYGAGVSACILFMNNKKEQSHKGKVCLIDGSHIYTPQRSQKILEPGNVDELFSLYANYEDVIEKCKIVTVEELNQFGNDLSVNKYIEKKQQKVISPESVKNKYYRTLQRVMAAEDKMMKLLEHIW